MTRHTRRDPQSGRIMLPGVTAIVSRATGIVTYQARWEWRDPLGRRNHGAKIYKSLDEAEAAWLEMQGKIRAGDFSRHDKVTVEDYATRWLDRMAVQWTYSVARQNRSIWRRIIRPRLGRMRIADVTRDHCQVVIDELVTAGRAPGTVRRYAQTLIALLRSAAADRVISGSPWDGLRFPRMSKRHPRVWSIDEVGRFLAATRARPYHDLWLLLVTTGLRLGEALALSWHDVDLAAGTVLVRATVRQVTGGTYDVVMDTKTGESRLVPLPPVTVEMLVQRQTRQWQQPAPVVHIRPLVFPSRGGRPFHENSIREQFARDIALAGVPRFPSTIHNPLRHVAATLLAQRKVQVRTAQGILGHSSPTMTLERYTHHDLTESRAALDDLAAAIHATTTTSQTAKNVGGV